MKKDSKVEDLHRLPCRIGDIVWCIKNYKKMRKAERAIVSEMYYTPDMRLIIVCRYICRGEFGKVVFNSQGEAQKEIDKDNKGGVV